MKDIIKEILDNTYYASIIIFLSQIIFIYLKTLNVIYTSEKKILGAILTGNGVSVLFLISIGIGINSIMGGEILPLITFLLGGTLGTYWGIKQAKKNDLK